MGGVKASSTEERMKRRRAAVKRALDKYMSDKHRIQVTLTPEEYSLIDRAANMCGVSPTAYVKNAAVNSAKNIAK